MQATDHRSASRPAQQWKTRSLFAISGVLALLAIAQGLLTTIDDSSLLVSAEVAVAAMLLSIAFVSFGRHILREHVVRMGWLDSASGVYNRSGLAPVTAELIRTRGVHTLVLLDFEDLIELPRLYGSTTAKQVIGELVGQLRHIAGSRGIAARMGGGRFAVVLPGHAEHAKRALARFFGLPARLEFEAMGDEIVLVPELRFAQLGEGHETDAGAAWRRLAEEVRRQRTYESRRLDWLARQRRRHSQASRRH